MAPDNAAGRVTVGELGRRLDQLQADLGQRLSDISIQLAQQGSVYVRKDVYDARHQTLEQSLDVVRDRVEEVEERGRWLTRAIFAALLTAIGGFVANLGYLVVHVH